MTMPIALDRLAVEAVAGLHCDRMRARPDQRHVAADYIYRLRQSKLSQRKMRPSRLLKNGC
jgi:hypothetical protein